MSEPSRSDPELDQTHFDHILIGTGLTNAILASALAKADKSVLHVDARGEYGAQLASHSFDSFADFIRANAQPMAATAAASAVRAPTAEEISRWRAMTKDDEEKFEFELLEQRTPFFDAQMTDFTLQQAEEEAAAAAEAAAKESAAAASVAAAAAAGDSDAAESDVAVASDAAAAPSAATPAPVAAKPVKSPLQSQSRRFSIDISPHLLFSRSPLIDLLVSSGIHHYVEFKAVDHAYFAQPPKAPATAAAAGAAPVAVAPALSLLPLSKSAIFQSSTLSMLEKRLLMKFLHLALGDDYHQPLEAENPKQAATAAAGPALPEAQRSQPFVDFLAEQKLSPQLRQMVLYAVALLDESAADVARVPASVGMERLRAYLSSVGRYGPGAFLYPNYGVSELPQAFARLCAVNRGVYILRFQPMAVVYERQQPTAAPAPAEEGKAAEASSAATPARVYKGVLTHGGQLLTSSSLIAESDYQHGEETVASASSSTVAHFITRCLLIVDGPLRAGIASDSLSPSSFFSLAPEGPAESPIYGVQLGSEVGATPRGFSLVHLFSTATSPAQAERNALRLRALASALTRPLAPQQDDDAAAGGLKPRLLAIASYQQRVMRPAVTAGVPAFAEAAPASGAASVASPTAASVVSSPLFASSPGASVALALDECLAEAASLFARLHPALNFRDCMRATNVDAPGDEDLALLQQIDAAQPNHAADDDDDEAAVATAVEKEGASTPDGAEQAAAASASTSASEPDVANDAVPQQSETEPAAATSAVETNTQPASS